VVRSKATLRSLIHATTEILRDSYEAAAEPEEMLNRAEQKVFAILDARKTADIVNIRDVIHKAMEAIDGKEDRRGIPTGFYDFDDLTGGLRESELIVLAARPSMGKTALALNIAEHVVRREHVPTLLVSLEMSGTELADRMLCSMAHVNSQLVRNRTLSVNDRKRLVETAAELSMCPLFIDDTSSRSMTEIAAASRRLKRKSNLGLIIIDYLQLIEPDNSRDQRHEQVGRIARRLKGLARELRIPVLCMAQLNRHAEESRPALSHLRESGSIEQDADVVVFIHRDREAAERNDPTDEDRNKTELIVAKQRNGPVGTVKLVWSCEFTRFQSAMVRSFDELDQWNQS
jgi:replicative DNA helicase